MKLTTLYHYTSEAGIKGIVTNKFLWSTHCRYLNDELEFRLIVDKVKQLMKRPGDWDGMANAYEFGNATLNHPDFLTKLTEHLPFVTSFSKLPDSLGQWRGYCPQGGFSLGFDASALINHIKMQGGRVLNCLYDEETQSMFFNDEWMDSMDLRQASGKWDEPYNLHEKVESFISRISHFASYFKDPSWEEEQECRAVLYPHKTPGQWEIKYRGENMSLPYIELPIEPEFLTEVIVGPRMNYENAKQLVKELLPHLGENDIKRTKVPLR